MASKNSKTTKKVIKRVNKKRDPNIYIPSLLNHYKRVIVPEMLKKFNYSNVMEVPKISSICLNIGLGDGKTNSKGLESAVNELTLISGQKAIVTLAKNDISNFKIRKGWPVGCKVTLRSKKMYEFLDRLISIALPRTRDFRGLSFKSFDSWGNYNFGIKEQIIFTEIDYDKIQSINGINVTIVTSSNNNDEAYYLLKMFGLPLRDRPKKNNEAE